MTGSATAARALRLLSASCAAAPLALSPPALCSPELHRDSTSERLEVDVAILGGGIAGSSLAYHLSKSEVPLSVVLLEASSCGSQATGLSAGTFWSAGYAKETSSPSQFDVTCEVNARSAALYEEVQGKGYDCGMTRCGNLTLARSEEERAFLVAEHSRLHSQGYNVLMLCNHEAVCQVEPALKGGNSVAALWTIESGYVDPLVACRSIMDAALCESSSSPRDGEHTSNTMLLLENEKGTLCPPHTMASDMRDVNSRQLIDIKTSKGNIISAREVVVASGFESRAVLEPLGIRVPVFPVKGTMMFFPANEKYLNKPAITHTIYNTEAALHWHQLYIKNNDKNEDCPRFCSHDRDNRLLTRHCYGRPTAEGDVLFGGTRIPLPESFKDNKCFSDYMTPVASDMQSVFNHVQEFYPILVKIQSDGNNATNLPKHVKEGSEQKMESVLGNDIGVWTGVMPFSLDGLPLMGSLASFGPQYRGLWVAGGYGPEGIMEAPGSTSFLADAIIDAVVRGREEGGCNPRTESTIGHVLAQDLDKRSVLHDAVMKSYDPYRKHGGIIVKKKAV